MTAVSHVVLVTWAAGKGAAAEAAVRPAIRGFGDTIPGVLGVVEGHSSSPEGREGGHDYGFVITFADSAARDTYLDHPQHRPVADTIGQSAADIVVFDITADV